VLTVLRVPLVLAVLVLHVPPVPALAQRGVISGQVIDGVSGRPITAAIVTLGGSNVARVPAADRRTCAVITRSEISRPASTTPPWRSTSSRANGSIPTCSRACSQRLSSSPSRGAKPRVWI
jgi:hypothetical protein